MARDFAGQTKFESVRGQAIAPLHRRGTASFKQCADPLSDPITNLNLYLTVFFCVPYSGNISFHHRLIHPARIACQRHEHVPTPVICVRMIILPPGEEPKTNTRVVTLPSARQIAGKQSA
jgi:hypothetical protein